MPRRYNLINIRTLLNEGFSDAELRDFCFDTPDFRPVYDELAQNTGKAELVRKLLEYAHQKRKLDPLLTWAEKNNPAQFQAHQPYLKNDPPASSSASPTPYISTPLTSAPPRLPASSPAPTPQPSNPPTFQPSNSPSLRIFLCHTAADKPAVRDLYHRLRSDGFEPWLDEEDLLPGQKWQKEIPKAVAASDVVIVCLSQAALTKAGYVQEEIKFALDVAEQQPEDSIFLIPLRLEECDVPNRLRGLHWVNLFDDKGYGRLVRGLKVKAEAKAESKEKPDLQAQFSISVSPLFHFPTPLLSILLPTYSFEPEMILIPAGEFLMGSDPKKDKDAMDNEQPQHTLFLTDYYMGKTPVTRTQYNAFIQATDYPKPDNWRGKTFVKDTENHPVSVNWGDVIAYCQWLTQITGKPYRLPTEAEWEKGARGTDGRLYPWGNQWETEKCNSSEAGKVGTTPVDFYPDGASPYGLVDMAGNNWEWCSTIWRERAYPYKIQQEWDKHYLYKTGDPRVVRGGVSHLDAKHVRCAYRFWFHPYNSFTRGISFRVVVSPAL